MLLPIKKILSLTIMLGLLSTITVTAKENFPLEFQYCLPAKCEAYNPHKPLPAAFSSVIKKTSPNCFKIYQGLNEYFKRPSVQEDLELFNIKKTFSRAEITLRQKQEGKCQISLKGFHKKSNGFKSIGSQKEFDPESADTKPRKIATDLVNALQSASADQAIKHVDPAKMSDE